MEGAGRNKGNDPPLDRAEKVPNCGILWKADGVGEGCEVSFGDQDWNDAVVKLAAADAVEQTLVLLDCL